MFLPPPSHEKVLKQITLARNRHLAPPYLQDLLEFMEALAEQMIPKRAPDFSGIDIIADDEIEHSIMLARSRTQRRHGMWSMVDTVWTSDLADWIDGRTCLEVMAGAGWLANALSAHGANVIATDLDARAKWGKRSTVHPVKSLDALTAITRHPEAEILLVSWPPYADKVIELLAEAWGSERPIIYIGEDRGGCTATEMFCMQLQITKSMKIPCWPSLHDEVMIGHYLFS